MTMNSLESQSLFRDSAEYLGLYQIALENAAGHLNEQASSLAFFDSQIKPTLINDQAVKFYFYKRTLSQLIIFNNVVKLNLARLGMAAAVFGENPLLSLSLDSQGKLDPIPESAILQAVLQQFNDNTLLSQLLDQDIFKIFIQFN